MRKPLKLALMVTAFIGVGLFFLFRPGFEEPGCACVPPPTLEEIAALTQVANQDDMYDSIEATGQVWSAYRLRKEADEAAIWEKRAISVGDPFAIGTMVSDLMFSVAKQPTPAAKLAKLKRAHELLKRAYPNRDMTSESSRHVFADKLLDTKASIKVLEDGTEVWERKAKAGDATAAGYLAHYYFWVEGSQDKRTEWEKKSAELGYPGFTWSQACCWQKTKVDLLRSKRLFAAARRNPAAWEGLGDPWIAAVLDEQLDHAEAQTDRRLAALGAR